MSTPSEPGRPHDGPALEPIRVLRPRRTDALAELLRDLPRHTEGHEAVALAPAAGRVRGRTQELPPVTTEHGNRTVGHRDGRPCGSGLRRTAVAVAVTAAAVLGFGAALLLPGRNDDSAAAPPPRRRPPPPPPPRSRRPRPTRTVPVSSARATPAPR